MRKAATPKPTIGAVGLVLPDTVRLRVDPAKKNGLVRFRYEERFEHVPVAVVRRTVKAMRTMIEGSAYAKAIGVVTKGRTAVVVGIVPRKVLGAMMAGEFLSWAEDPETIRRAADALANALGAEASDAPVIVGGDRTQIAEVHREIERAMAEAAAVGPRTAAPNWVRDAVDRTAQSIRDNPAEAPVTDPTSDVDADGFRVL